MLKFNHELNTSFDPIKKIWSGGNYRAYYDESCSIGRIIYEEMRRNPKRICQISDSEKTQLTNEEVLLQATKIARYFESLGITQSDIIGIAAKNTTYLLGLVLACFFHGAAFHGISTFNPKETTKHLLNITKPRIIFCDADILDKVHYAISGWNSKVAVITMKDRIIGTKNIRDLLETPIEDLVYFQPRELENGSDQTLCIMCSSGSTGMPKAVTISNNTRIFEYANYLTSHDVLFLTSTIEWISCLFGILTSVVYGSKRIITELPVTPNYFLEIVQKYKVTFTFQPPLSMSGLVNFEGTAPEKLESLRVFSFGGDKCHADIQHKLQSLLRNGRISCGYTFTELGRIMTRNFDFEAKPKSAGRLMPGFDVKIVNEKGVALGANEIGELLIYYGKTWNGYYSNAEATREMLDAEGWFHSGDLGYFDEDQYLYIVDRKKNLLKFRSMPFLPNEVEEVIANMPQVLDVCVFGVWSEADGDAAAAVVVVKRGSSLAAEDVVAYVQENTSEYHKQLHGGAAIWEVLPKTACGKVDRPEVKRIYTEQYHKSTSVLK